MHKNTGGHMSEKLLRVRDVLALIPISRSTLRKWIKVGRFPKPTQMGERIAVWNESVVKDWIENQKN